MGVGRAQEAREAHAREHEIVGEDGLPGDLGRRVDLDQRLPDDGEVLAVLLRHASAPCPSPFPSVYASGHRRAVGWPTASSPPPFRSLRVSSGTPCTGTGSPPSPPRSPAASPRACPQAGRPRSAGSRACSSRTGPLPAPQRPLGEDAGSRPPCLPRS